MAFSAIQPLRLLTNDTAAGVFPTFNLSGNADWKGNANPVIPDTTWGYLLAAYAVLIAVKEGVQGIGGLACSRPIMVLLVNALAAIVFSFVLIILALMMKLDITDTVATDGTVAAIQFLRSTLLLGSIFMAFGFLVVFIPADGNKYTPTTSFGRAVVTAFQTPWMRMIALGAYTFMVAAQLAVAGSIYVVSVNILELAETDAIGIAVVYILFSAFYLMAFASTMLQKKFMVNGEYIVDNLREGAKGLLEHRAYKYVYIVFHVMVTTASLGVLIYFFIVDVNASDKKSTADSEVVAILFFAVSVIGVLALVVQLFNDAFSPKKIPQSRLARIALKKQQLADERTELGKSERKYNAKLASLNAAVAGVAKVLTTEVARLDEADEYISQKTAFELDAGLSAIVTRLDAMAAVAMPTSAAAAPAPPFEDGTKEIVVEEDDEREEEEEDDDDDDDGRDAEAAPGGGGGGGSGGGGGGGRGRGRGRGRGDGSLQRQQQQRVQPQSSFSQGNLDLSDSGDSGGDAEYDALPLPAGSGPPTPPAPAPPPASAPAPPPASVPAPPAGSGPPTPPAPVPPPASALAPPAGSGPPARRSSSSNSSSIPAPVVTGLNELGKRDKMKQKKKKKKTANKKLSAAAKQQSPSSSSALASVSTAVDLAFGDIDERGYGLGGLDMGPVGRTSSRMSLSSSAAVTATPEAAAATLTATTTAAAARLSVHNEKPRKLIPNAGVPAKDALAAVLDEVIDTPHVFALQDTAQDDVDAAAARLEEHVEHQLEELRADDDADSGKMTASYGRTALLVGVFSIIGAGCGLPVGSFFGVLAENLVVALIAGSAVGAGIGAMAALYFANRCCTCIYKSTAGAIIADDFKLSDTDTDDDDDDGYADKYNNNNKNSCINETAIDDSAVGDVLSF